MHSVFLLLFIQRITARLAAVKHGGQLLIIFCMTNIDCFCFLVIIQPTSYAAKQYQEL